jgi:serine protease Do
MRRFLFTTMLLSVPAILAAQTPRPMRVASTGGAQSFIGVNIQEIDSERAKALKLREEAGVEITRVEPDGPAEKAGIKPGDVVTHFNGQRLEGIDQFKRMVTETPVGRDVKLDVIRNGATQTVTVKIGARRVMKMPMLEGGPFAMTLPLEQMNIQIPDMPRSHMTWRSSMLGVEAESLDGQLAQYFGVKEGILVRSVSKNSAAEKAGIKAGDVIVKVEDSSVATPADMSSRLRGLRNKTASFVVVRDRKDMTLSVAIGDEDHNEWFFKQDFNAPAVRPRPLQIN